jgi:hypothetical protein
MSKPIHYGLRFVAIVTVVGALSLLFVPSQPIGSPYSSALSTLEMSPLFAATSCNTVCFSPRNGGASRCISGGGPNTQCVKNKTGGGCTTQFTCP